MTKYLLDANVFIQAKNLHYGLDFCPAFWNWLIAENAKGKVISIEKVADELFAGDDSLSEWARKRDKTFFVPPNNLILTSLKRVSEWVNAQNYETAAINTFLQEADYWLVAHALSDKNIIVTHEIPSESTRKIKIPNVCIGLNLQCVTPYEMLRRERARFILGETKEVV